MALLSSPPIDTAITDKNGKPTQVFSNWLVRLYNRIGRDNGGLAPNSATYITKTPDSGLTAAFALSLLDTGYAKVATGSGTMSTVTMIPNTDIMGLGTLSTQNGTFSGTSSGTNTGDQTNISGNAATVTTNANLTGPVTSVGNATTIVSGVVTEDMQILADNTTNNCSTAKHGYLKKLSNTSTEFMNGAGNWAVPAGTTVSVVAQVFTGSGTYTPTTGMKYCIAEAVGGGGGGAGVSSSAANVDGGSGGGGGGYARKVFSAATIGVSQTVTIGAAGSAGSAGANGGNGGNTTLGSLLTGNGGTGGIRGGASTVTTGVTGSAGGTGVSGDFNITGGTGGAALYIAASGGLSGSGGNSYYGQGGGAKATASSSVGVAGTGYGAGGSGGIAVGATTAVGGAGTAGIIIITEYF